MLVENVEKRVPQSPIAKKLTRAVQAAIRQLRAQQTEEKRKRMHLHLLVLLRRLVKEKKVTPSTSLGVGAATAMSREEHLAIQMIFWTLLPLMVASGNDPAGKSITGSPHGSYHVFESHGIDDQLSSYIAHSQ